MNLCPMGFTLFAPDCSSWGIPARGTSMRSFINAEGHTAYEFVSKGNLMVSRKLSITYVLKLAAEEVSI